MFSKEIRYLNINSTLFETNKSEQILNQTRRDKNSPSYLGEVKRRSLLTVNRKKRLLLANF